MKYTTGLYVRLKGSDRLWEELLGGKSYKAKPSELYERYFADFEDLHATHEWVVLERRCKGKSHRTAMYEVGGTNEVDVLPEVEENWILPASFEEQRQVECLSLWHMDLAGKMFRGSSTNRVCPKCVRKEQDWLSGKGRDYG